MSRGDEIFEWNTPRYTKRELHAAFASARAEARREALEEAAKIAETEPHYVRASYGVAERTTHKSTRESIAKAIRALIDKEPQEGGPK